MSIPRQIDIGDNGWMIKNILTDGSKEIEIGWDMPCPSEYYSEEIIIDRNKAIDMINFLKDTYDISDDEATIASIN